MVRMDFEKRVADIFFYRHALWDLALKQLKAKYAGSVLGVFWAIVNPMLVALAITCVFSGFSRMSVGHYSLFVLSGIFLWMFFSCALTESSSVFLSQAAILRQFNIPKEILPLSSILANFLNFMIGWVVVFPLFLFQHPKIIFFLPFILIVLFLFLFLTWGVGLALSVLNVFVRDLGHLLGVLLMCWFWITPVFYSLDMLPVKFRWIAALNPVTLYVIDFRALIFYGQIPSAFSFFLLFLLSVLTLLLGLSIFARFESNLLKRI